MSPARMRVRKNNRRHSKAVLTEAGGSPDNSGSPPEAEPRAE